ncbi:D-alanyl-D-alanine carboxypeptidase [Paenibacillus barcinonensis]|uniref:serine-type D-Ala-D-Ala carboxypeptidase n=2 Tax=Paenibacillus barcinonensis TaxID=198119 RepID=A0A2V4W0P5_PAEBA|nr:D-alanyl-D-alanine carboxypeptidase (penicillin-binding protein 5/6) [Paenibacillus barcinonensis]QKS56053.1 D-alanyl-D-alanine carboxypeptidase [Paenibacillus barcinonensis]
MRKRIWASFMTVCMLLPLMTAPAVAEEAPKASGGADLAPSARSAILMDADTGTVIYEKNSHDQLPPASITKIMTMLLTMEAIDSGKLKLTDKVRTSEYAASMGGSQIFLEPGEEMSVDDMLKGIAMASGNDASVAMAEKLAGSEEAFVQLMNERAQELGMKDTRFANANGLPVTDHYSSAHDIAVMSRELLKHQGITKYTGAYQDYLRKDSEKPFWLVNTNKLVRFYQGADGLKTGYTSEAKFCLSATASKDGLRVVAVVLGEPNTKTRNSEVSSMFDYAFAQYTMKSLYKAGDLLGSLKIEKGDVAELPLNASQNYSVLMRKGAKSNDIRHELIVAKELKAPIKAGQSIGKLVVYQGNEVIKEFDIQAPQDVGKAGWWKLFKRTTSGLFD